MNQAALDLPPTSADTQRPADRTAFEIGWDHAHHGLVPHAELLLDGTPVCQGWMAGRAVFGQRRLGATRSVRLWLTLRTLAWRQGITFEAQEVTPAYLAQIHVDRCPVLRLPLGGAPGDALSAVVERLDPQAGYAAGNLVTMSLRASQARAGLGVADVVRRARKAEANPQTVNGLDAAAWWRLAALAGYARRLPFAEAARLPMALLPPNRVRVLNAVQGLQAVCTRLFSRPGWAARARALGAMLPEHTLRHDFNLFVGAMAPRVLDAAQDTAGLHQALEDAWLHERVQRRWQHLVLSLGEAATEALLERAAAAGMAGMRTLTDANESAAGPAAADAGLPRGGRASFQRQDSIFAAPKTLPHTTSSMGARLS